MCVFYLSYLISHKGKGSSNKDRFSLLSTLSDLCEKDKKEKPYLEEPFAAFACAHAVVLTRRVVTAHRAQTLSMRGATRGGRRARRRRRGRHGALHQNSSVTDVQAVMRESQAVVLLLLVLLVFPQRRESVLRGAVEAHMTRGDVRARRGRLEREEARHGALALLLHQVALMEAVQRRRVVPRWSEARVTRLVVGDSGVLCVLLLLRLLVVVVVMRVSSVRRRSVLRLDREMVGGAVWRKLVQARRLGLVARSSSTAGRVRKRTEAGQRRRRSGELRVRQVHAELDELGRQEIAAVLVVAVALTRRTGTRRRRAILSLHAGHL